MLFILWQLVALMLFAASVVLPNSHLSFSLTHSLSLSICQTSGMDVFESFVLPSNCGCYGNAEDIPCLLGNRENEIKGGIKGGNRRFQR